MYGLSLNYIGHHSKLVLELEFEIVAFVSRARVLPHWWYVNYALPEASFVLQV